MPVWTWNTERATFDPVESAGPLLLADSWYLREGRVRALPRHRARFAAAAQQLELPSPDAPEIWSQIVDLLPPTGEWFPRIEFVGGAQPTLGIRPRPAPARTQEISVWVPAFPDIRRSPHFKGPDIERLEDLRMHARDKFGCQEVLLLSPDGYVIEGATSNILWWENGKICVPDIDLEPFSGITTTLLQEEARSCSLPVEHRRAVPDDLKDKEVWMLNALHGVRRVARWSGSTTAPSTPPSFWTWREWLDSLMVNVAGGRQTHDALD
ncbi:aminotransferase class IV [Propioniciclava flava]|uniref:Aminotransferase class IV n=1 Tax=Propioniciclava flava TaxID=2072026 RepID=A0A4Q2EN80_9ACTN|nr:aminotransferase class IV [Propioniciclava flava]